MKVKFLPQGIEIPISPEKTLLQAALENGINIRSICKGKLVCCECRVKIVEGETNILPPTAAEKNVLGSAWQLDSRRFSCQVRCFGDVTVDLSEQIQRDESARKKIRGFKSSRPATESRAVVDTMLLNEKVQELEAPASSDAREGARSESKQESRQDQGGGRSRNRRRGGERRPGPKS